jgi:peptide/nickel transport system permease protein
VDEESGDGQTGKAIGIVQAMRGVSYHVDALPGLGWTAVQAINQQDLPVIVGIVVLAAAFVVLANVLVDIGYALLDPRVRPH